MSSQNLSRRLLMSIAPAAAVAAALPQSAVALPGESIDLPSVVDPIFAAIETHRAAVRRLEDAVGALDDLDSKHSALREVPRIIVRRERTVFDYEMPAYGPLVKTKRKAETPIPVYASFDAEIEKLSLDVPKSRRAKWIRDKKALLRRAIQKHVAERAKVGLPGREKEAEAANEAYDDAAFELVKAPPTTMAGVIALLSYAAEAAENGHQWDEGPQLFDDDEDREVARPWSFFLHRGLSEALRNLATA